jgi:hypothetical protein
VLASLAPSEQSGRRVVVVVGVVVVNILTLNVMMILKS